MIEHKKWVDGKGWVPEAELTPDDLEAIERHHRLIAETMTKVGRQWEPQVKRRKPK